VSRLQVTYHVHSDARSIDDRAQAIAVEQSVEMPLRAIADDRVRSDIVGRVETIRELASGQYEVQIALAAVTTGNDAGQLINMLFGNSSIQDDVVLHDVAFPAGMEKVFGGPRHGLHALRQRADAGRRALTCSALKPQGLSPAKLAELARRFAEGGIDYIKDDHGLADQVYCPFAARVEAIAEMLLPLRASGHAVHYVPSLTGDLDRLRQQAAIARSAGIDTVMVAPMISGLSNFHRLVVENRDLAFLAHPALAGAARIAPPLLFGKIFRMLGADAVVFPNHGGRFGYSPATCRQIAHAALGSEMDLKPSVPVPAGGMSRERVPEILDFYGPDIMLLIGGNLLETRDRLVEATAAFVSEVRNHPYH
jgi:ribulose-bisphosphate carboxylase large chain